MEETSKSQNVGSKSINRKKWREKKYKNHSKVEEWQAKRKKIALHKYHKMLRKEQIFVNKPENSFSPVQENRSKPRMNRYQEAMMEYERIRQEKEKRIEEARQAKAERIAAQERSRKLRAERQRKLSKRTSKGQPVMKERLELLLEKIQNSQKFTEG